MDRRHFDALLAVELRRLLPLFRRLLVGTLAIDLLFVVAGRATAANIFGLLVGAAAGYVLGPPLQMTRDKMEHTLEFLTGLPAPPGTIAAAKFAAAAIFIVPAGLQIALGFAWYGHATHILGGNAFGALSICALGLLIGASWLMLALAGVATEPELYVRRTDGATRRAGDWRLRSRRAAPPAPG